MVWPFWKTSEDKFSCFAAAKLLVNLITPVLTPLPRGSWWPRPPFGSCAPVYRNRRISRSMMICVCCAVQRLIDWPRWSPGRGRGGDTESAEPAAIDLRYPPLSGIVLLVRFFAHAWQAKKTRTRCKWRFFCCFALSSSFFVISRTQRCWGSLALVRFWARAGGGCAAAAAGGKLCKTYASKH